MPLKQGNSKSSSKPTATAAGKGGKGAPAKGKPTAQAIQVAVERDSKGKRRKLRKAYA